MGNREEVMNVVNSVLATEIHKVVFDESPLLTNSDKMALIRGIYLLYDSIDGKLKEEEAE